VNSTVFISKTLENPLFMGIFEYISDETLLILV
jgi:hypothetical protein